MREIFDLANTTNESQIKGEQQLKCLAESNEFISARFDANVADRKKKDEMINNLAEKVLGLLTNCLKKLTNCHPWLTDRNNIPGEIVFSYTV